LRRRHYTLPPSLRRMTHLAGCIPLRLGILQTDRDLARHKVPASVAVILLARAGDVDGLGLWVLLGRGSSPLRWRLPLRQPYGRRRRRSSRGQAHRHDHGC
jgi:hypothetical protein